MSRLTTTNMSAGLPSRAAFQTMSADRATSELDALPGKRKLAEMQAGSSSSDDNKQRATGSRGTDPLWNRPRPVLQGIRRRRRPSSLRPVRAIVPPPAGGPLTPLTPQAPNSLGSSQFSRETTTTDSALASIPASPSQPMSLTEGEEQRWQDVDRNVRRMDEMFDASFHPWLRSEANVWISAGYLQRLAREFPAERTAQAVAWLAEGWRVESSAVLVRVITHNWCQEDMVPAMTMLVPDRVHGDCCHRCCCCYSALYHNTGDVLRNNDTIHSNGNISNNRQSSNLRLIQTHSAPSPLAVSMAPPPILPALPFTQPDYTSSPQLRNTAKIVRAISRQYPPVQVAQLITNAFGDICPAKLQALVELITAGWDAGRFVTLVAGLGTPIDVRIRISLLERAQRICRQANEAERTRQPPPTTLSPSSLMTPILSGRVALQRMSSTRYGVDTILRQGAIDNQEKEHLKEDVTINDDDDDNNDDDDDDSNDLEMVIEEMTKEEEEENENIVDDNVEQTEAKRQRLESSTSSTVRDGNNSRLSVH